MNTPQNQREEALLNAGIISKEQMDKAKETQKTENIPLEMPLLASAIHIS